MKFIQKKKKNQDSCIVGWTRLADFLNSKYMTNNPKISVKKMVEYSVKKSLASGSSQYCIVKQCTVSNTCTAPHAVVKYKTAYKKLTLKNGYSDAN